MEVPVVAQVDALAAAAGCQLVASCDIVVAGEKASFSTPGWVSTNSPQEPSSAVPASPACSATRRAWLWRAACRARRPPTCCSRAMRSVHKVELVQLSSQTSFRRAPRRPRHRDRRRSDAPLSGVGRADRPLVPPRRANGQVVPGRPAGNDTHERISVVMLHFVLTSSRALPVTPNI